MADGGRGNEVESGTLLLADIGGYTAYLTGVELEHSHDILADLIGTVTEQTKGAFRHAKRKATRHT